VPCSPDPSRCVSLGCSGPQSLCGGHTWAPQGGSSCPGLPGTHRASPQHSQDPKASPFSAGGPQPHPTLWATSWLVETILCHGTEGETEAQRVMGSRPKPVEPCCVPTSGAVGVTPGPLGQLPLLFRPCLTL
jgi:hypothetical protein